jgi:hypothetical protein
LSARKATRYEKAAAKGVGFELSFSIICDRPEFLNIVIEDGIFTT